MLWLSIERRLALQIACTDVVTVYVGVGAKIAGCVDACVLASRWAVVCHSGPARGDGLCVRPLTVPFVRRLTLVLDGRAEGLSDVGRKGGRGNDGVGRDMI